MKISFVIPAYNEEAYVGDCVRSVFREIERGTYEAEVIVVNNASTDRTREVALSFPGVVVVDEMRKGLTFARAAGFAASRGELIANVDSDARLPEGWLAIVMKRFEKDSKLVALSGPFVYFDLGIVSRFWVKFFYIIGLMIQKTANLIMGNVAMLQGGNFVVRRTALEAIGGFDTSIAFYGEDTDIARRISYEGKVVWTFSLPMYASGRRLEHEGVIRMGLKYAVNFFSTAFFGKPYTKEYIDIRVKN